MMLRKLIVKGFQSHEDTTLALSPGVNVIVGSSNSGKTALLRGLNWVRTNRPRGTSFIQKGSPGAKVTIVVVDGKTGIEHTAGRERTSKGGRNAYTLDAETFEAVGTDVPDDVLRALNLGDVNVQGQLEPHFLILGSPGAIADTINTAVKLNVGTEATAKLTKMVRDVMTERFSGQERLDQLEEEIVHPALALPERFDKLVQRPWIKRRYALDRLERKRRGLAALLEQVEAVDDEIATTKSFQVPKDIQGLADEMEAEIRLLEKLEWRERNVHGALGVLAEVDLNLQDVKEDLLITEQVKGKLMSSMKVCPLCRQIIKRRRA